MARARVVFQLLSKLFTLKNSRLFNPRLIRFLVSALVLLMVPPLLYGERRYDFIIQGGQVVDGTGSPAYDADIAIHRGKIVEIGDLTQHHGKEIINASGLTVSPGFIDTHSHAGPGLTTKNLSHARPLLTQGITTVFINPDGGGATDLSAQKRALRKHGLGVNVAQFVAHGSLRREVMGFDARKPTNSEQKTMERIVKRAMRNGAWGLSSGTFYTPGSYARPEEIVDLARIASKYGGVYQSHIRDESNYSVGLLAAVEEVINVGRQANLPAVITHIKALGPPVWGLSENVIGRINMARREGVEVYTDQYPYTASATGLTAALVPRWAQAGGMDSLLIRLGNPETELKIREEMKANLARRGGAKRIQFRRVSFDPSLEGQRLDDAAKAWNVSPIDAALRLLTQGYVGIVSFNMSGEDVRAFMVQPWTMTASDGGLVPWMEGIPHPRSYGAFTEKIERYVKKETVLDLQTAVRSMTSLPSSVYGMDDRGVLKKGAVADIVIFDLEKMKTPATYASPHELSEGVVHLFVNGNAVIRYSQFTGILAGEVLQKK